MEDFQDRSVDWLLDELERMVSIEQGLYHFEWDNHKKRKQAIKDEIKSRIYFPAH